MGGHFKHRSFIFGGNGLLSLPQMMEFDVDNFEGSLGYHSSSYAQYCLSMDTKHIVRP
jgi:hypothetical protein